MIIHCRVELFVSVYDKVKIFPAPLSSNGSLTSQERRVVVHRKRTLLALSLVHYCSGPTMRASDLTRIDQPIVQLNQCLTIELMLAAANHEKYPDQVFG